MWFIRANSCPLSSCSLTLHLLILASQEIELNYPIHQVTLSVHRIYPLRETLVHCNIWAVHIHTPTELIPLPPAEAHSSLIMHTLSSCYRNNSLWWSFFLPTLWHSVNNQHKKAIGALKIGWKTGERQTKKYFIGKQTSKGGHPTPFSPLAQIIPSENSLVNHFISTQHISSAIYGQQWVGQKRWKFHHSLHFSS